MSNTRARKPVTPKPSGLRAALAAKQVRTEVYDIPTVDRQTTLARADAYNKAAQQAFVMEMSDNEDLKVSTAKKAAEAKAALDACSYRITLRGIPDVDRDALRNEFPQDEAVKFIDDPFNYELLARSVVDGDGMTAEEWREVLSDRKLWPDTDVIELLAAVSNANFRSFSDGIPKG